MFSYRYLGVLLNTQIFPRFPAVKIQIKVNDYQITGQTHFSIPRSQTQSADLTPLPLLQF